MSCSLVDLIVKARSQIFAHEESKIKSIYLPIWPIKSFIEPGGRSGGTIPVMLVLICSIKIAKST